MNNIRDNNNLELEGGKRRKRDKGKKRDKNKRRALDILNGLDRGDFTNKYNSMCRPDMYIPAILPKQERVVVLGDIHGDLQLAKNMLIAAKVAKENSDGSLEWCGGKTYVVQVGDQIDRCRPIGNMTCSNPKTTFNDEASDVKILNLYTKMHLQARRVGGAVISLLGNHELLNAMGRMDYVSYEGIKEFEKYKDPKDPSIEFKSPYHARVHAFTPGNEYGRLLGCTRLPAVIVGSNIFVHAGIVDGLIRRIGLTGNNDFETINQAIRGWLLGLLKTDYVQDIIDSSKYSMFWTRILGKIPPNVSVDNPVCQNHIGNVLKMFNVNGIIVGHTPQSFLYSDDINATCDGIVWRVDNASSAAFHKYDREFLNTGKVTDSRRIQYLEIINDTTYNTCDAEGCKRTSSR